MLGEVLSQKRASFLVIHPFRRFEMFKNAYRAAKSAIRNKAVQVGTLVTVAAGNAMAATDPAITTAISDGQADGKTIAVGVLILIIGVGVLKHVRRGV